MNEYTVLYLNGITVEVMADNWKEAIKEGVIYAKRKEFSPKIKYIMDGEGTLIKNIDETQLTFNYSQINLSHDKV